MLADISSYQTTLSAYNNMKSYLGQSKLVKRAGAYAPIMVKLLTAKSILTGMKNSCSEGFLLAKQTAHKHLHHD
jgi:hypothetical protein